MKHLSHALLFVAALAALLANPARAAAETGRPAPDFTLTDIAGKKHSLADYKGKTVVLEWVNQGCPFVQKQYQKSGNMPKLQQAATADGVHFSLDGGSTWEDRSKGLESVRVIRAVDVRPDDTKVLLAAANSQVDAATQGDALYESGDGGKSWTKVVRSFPEKPPIDRIVDIRYDPSYPDNTAVAFASGELWMTRNAGIYWQPFARQIREARALCPVV